MTVLTTVAPVIIRRQVFAPVKLPRPGISRAVERTLEAFGQALDLAYVQPYRFSKNKLPIVLEGSEKGRDPSW